MATAPLMPKATAVWLVENTSLSFDQIAQLCNLHPLEVKAIADGDAAQGIKGLDPILTGQLTREEIAAAKRVTISELSPSGEPTPNDLAAALGLPPSATREIVDQEVFESLYHPGKQLLLVSWRHSVAADQWAPKPEAPGELRHRQVRIIRDYGMADRREAPQYYPPVHVPAARG